MSGAKDQAVAEAQNGQTLPGVGREKGTVGTMVAGWRSVGGDADGGVDRKAPCVSISVL